MNMNTGAEAWSVRAKASLPNGDTPISLREEAMRIQCTHRCCDLGSISRNMAIVHILVEIRI